MEDEADWLFKAGGVPSRGLAEYSVNDIPLLRCDDSVWSSQSEIETGAMVMPPNSNEREFLLL